MSVLTWFVVSRRSELSDWARGNTRKDKPNSADDKDQNGPDKAESDDFVEDVLVHGADGVANQLLTLIFRCVLRLPFGWLAISLLPGAVALDSVSSLIHLSTKGSPHDAFHLIGGYDAALHWWDYPTHVLTYLIFGGALIGLTIAGVRHVAIGEPEKSEENLGCVYFGTAAFFAVNLALFVLFFKPWP